MADEVREQMVAGVLTGGRSKASRPVLSPKHAPMAQHRPLDKRGEAGATSREALRSLKRRLSDINYQAMLVEAAQTQAEPVAA